MMFCFMLLGSDVVSVSFVRYCVCTGVCCCCVVVRCVVVLLSVVCDVLFVVAFILVWCVLFYLVVCG